MQTVNGQVVPEIDDFRTMGTNSGMQAVVDRIKELVTNIAETSSQNSGFFGAAPTTRPSGSSQDAVVTSVTTAATTTNLKAMVANVITLLNKLRANPVTLKLIKGSA